MATTEQENQARGVLTAALGVLAAIVPESLVRKGELGTELSFESGLPYFRRNLELLKRLGNQNIDTLPFSIHSTLGTMAQQQIAYFKQVQEFTLGKYPQNAVANRDNFINQIRDSYDGLFSAIFPVLSFLSDEGKDFALLESQARGKIKSIESFRKEIEAAKTKELAEVESVLEKVRKAAAEVGVSQHAINFADEAKYHERKGIHWLAATIALTMINIAYALIIAFYYSDVVSPTLTTSQIVEGAVSKLIAFSILSFGMIWCSRNYRAHRNGHIVNKHRQNALSTFETFVKATSDEQTKNAVLMQAAQSIFTPQNTGYLTSDSEQVQSTKILEIIRGVIAKE